VRRLAGVLPWPLPVEQPGCADAEVLVRKAPQGPGAQVSFKLKHRWYPIARSVSLSLAKVYLAMLTTRVATAVTTRTTLMTMVAELLDQRGSRECLT
jgi:hypothetical protein